MVGSMSRSDSSAAQYVLAALVELSRLEAALTIHDGRDHDDLDWNGVRCGRIGKKCGRRGRM
jgi:hypothetical protein